MNIIIFRHGLAEDKTPGQDEMDDFRRELTDTGSYETKKMVKRLRYLFRKIDVIFSSPLVRAIQTADIIYNYNTKAHYEIMESLDPLFAPQICAEEIRQLSPDKTYCFIGHEPHLTGLVNSLLDSVTTINLAKSGVIVLGGDGARNLELKMILSPEILLKLR